MTKRYSLRCAAALLATTAGLGLSHAAHSAGVLDAIGEGKPLINVVGRYEAVDQDGFAEDASAPLVRARLGYATGSYEGLSATFDFDFIRAIDSDEYNSTVDGNAAYPVVADPEGEELNRLFLTYTGIPDTKVDLGRQRVILDNARFVGNVGWRLNEQTYDAVFLSNTSVEGLKLTYGYIDKVHRIFGNDSPNGNWSSDSHVFNAAYTGFKPLSVTGYAYLLDLQAAALSTATYGLRANGSYDLDGFSIGYTGEYAHQTDHGDNPNDVSLDYFLVSLSGSVAGFTLSGTYEVLEGDGTVGFATPLATLHAFQGWADVFLATPATGIEDLYATLKYNFAGIEALKGLAFTAVYHDFSAEQGGADLGEEIDLLLSYKITPNLTGLVKYADYDGPAIGPASRSKTWIALTFNY